MKRTPRQRRRAAWLADALKHSARHPRLAELCARARTKRPPTIKPRAERRERYSVRYLGALTRTHRARPRGWRIAGMRSHSAIGAARLDHMQRLYRGETPSTRVTRRWPS